MMNLSLRKKYASELYKEMKEALTTHREMMKKK